MATRPATTPIQRARGDAPGNDTDSARPWRRARQRHGFSAPVATRPATTPIQRARGDAPGDDTGRSGRCRVAAASGGRTSTWCWLAGPSVSAPKHKGVWSCCHHCARSSFRYCWSWAIASSTSRSSSHRGRGRRTSSTARRPWPSGAICASPARPSLRPSPTPATASTPWAGSPWAPTPSP